MTLEVRAARIADAASIAALHATSWLETFGNALSDEYRSGQSGLYLLVLEQNKRARAFYERLGATDVGGETWVPPGFIDAPSRRYAWERDQVAAIRRLAGESTE